MTSQFSEEKINIGFQELQPENAIPVSNLIRNGGISKINIPEKSGVYIFWWNGTSILKKQLAGCTYQVKAKASHEVEMINIKFSEE